MPDHIGRVLRAMECGKWPDGRPVPDKLRIAVRPSKKAKGNEYHVLPEHKIAQYIPISEREGDIYWKHKVNV